MITKPTTDAIWTHLSADLLRFIRSRVSDDHVAADLLQETFVRVHRNLETVQDSERLAAWVYQIARNVARDHHRMAENAIVSLADVDPADDETYEPQAAFGGFSWLDEMIQSLPDGYRQAVQMAEIEGLAQQDIADRLSLSLSGAKSRVQRGRVMLKEVLERCCSFEMDSRGRIMGCDPKPNQQVCRDCGE